MPLSIIISFKFRQFYGYFKYHLTFNKIISPTKCFHLKELDSMSLPLISFLFYYILGRYFCNGTGELYKENSKHFFVCKDGKIYIDIIHSQKIIFHSAFLSRSYFRLIAKFMDKR